MKELSHNNYNLKPYYVEHIFWFIYGLYYDGTLLRRGGYNKMSDMANCSNSAFVNGVCKAIVLDETNLSKYNLKPYYLKSFLIFYEGLYYEEQILYWGGITVMMDFKNQMNGAFMNGICHAIVVNS